MNRQTWPLILLIFAALLAGSCASFYPRPLSPAHLVAVEGVDWGPEGAVRGAAERLAPILMTALVTALGLLPLALGSRTPGQEVVGPMAIVILGGLVTSTSLNLLVLPTLALKYGRFKNVTEAKEVLK